MRLFVAAGGAVAAVTEGDSGWTARLLLPDSGVRALALDTAAARTMYAGGRHGVVKTSDGGESWEACGPPDADVFSVAVSPADGAVYAGCEPSSLLVSRDGGTSWTELASLKQIPSAPTWSFPPRPWTSHVRWIAPSPHEAGLLLVGIELGGLMLSEDGGETWLDHRPGAQRDVHALAWHPRVAGRAYEAAGGGAAWSFDAGRSWQPADEGRDRHYTWALAVDPADADCWYVSASPGPRRAHADGRAAAHLYRWRARGPWQRLAGGLPDPLASMPYALAVADGPIVAGLGDGSIYRSGDAGESWEELAVTGDRLTRISALVAAP